LVSAHDAALADADLAEYSIGVHPSSMSAGCDKDRRRPFRGLTPGYVRTGTLGSR
jgi:hypothetical protein